MRAGSEQILLPRGAYDVIINHCAKMDRDDWRADTRYLKRQEDQYHNDRGEKLSMMTAEGLGFAALKELQASQEV